MRIRGSLEQAICIVLLISTSSRPVKSSELSKKLNVSDSYLKKIMRKQVKEKEEKIMHYLHGAELEYRKKLKEITIQQILSDV